MNELDAATTLAHSQQRIVLSVVLAPANTARDRRFRVNANLVCIRILMGPAVGFSLRAILRLELFFAIFGVDTALRRFLIDVWS